MIKYLSIFMVLLLCMGVVVAAEYKEDVNKYFLKSTVYIWTPSVNATIEKISIDGELEGTGSVRIHLIKGGNQFLIYSRSPKNETQYNVEDYVGLAEGDQIGMTLAYGDGDWDLDNDGVDQISGGVDLTFGELFFVKPLNESNMCTIWEVYSEEEEAFTTTCYGATPCCNFLGYPSRLDTWDEDYVVVYGQDGATDNNFVLARIVYFGKDQIARGPYDGLKVSFVDDNVAGSVENITSLFDSNQNLLRITLDENTFFRLSSITYVTDEPDTPVVVNTTPSNQTPIKKPFESIVNQTDNFFSVFFPVLDKKTGFEVTNALAVSKIDLFPSEPFLNASVELELVSADGINQLFELRTPSRLDVSLLFSVPVEVLEGDVERFHIYSWNESWSVLPIRYSHSDGTYAYYNANVRGSRQLRSEVTSSVPQVAVEETKGGFPLLTFILLFLTIMVVLVILVMYGLKNSAYRELFIDWEEIKYRWDMRKIHKIRKKYD